MKLSHYAKQKGVTYKTAHRWWKAGKLKDVQLDTGTILLEVAEATTPRPTGVALYARVSSADQKADLARQVERLQTYAAAKGYQVAKQVTEIASGLNDKRPKLAKLLGDPTIGVSVVEHKDRLTRFGFNYIETLLAAQSRRVEVIFPSDTDKELVDDFVAVITSMAARIYGSRNSRHKARQAKECVTRLMQPESQE
jgi:predicted site-specific integrase-resolvase